mgnify:FL=1
MRPVILCVAEKPSLASSIAKFLARGGELRHEKHGLDVHECVSYFPPLRCALALDYAAHERV